MTDNNDRFPPIRELEDLPFMRTIPGFAEVRANNIADMTASMVSLLNELPDFANVPDDAKAYLARRTALHSERLFEAGIQEGIDAQRDVDEARARESHMFAMRVIGN